MEKKKVPLEKDVDIEFEYKVYMIYDFLKSNLKFVIAGVVLVALLIGAFFYYKYQQEEILNRSSVMAYNIQKAFSQKKYDEAQKLIEKLKKEYPDSPFVKVALSYELLIKKEKNSISPDDLNKLQVRVKSKQLNSGLTEFKGYLYFKNGDYGKTLGVIKPINQEFYNYVSALTLKGFTLKKLGKDDLALEAFKQIQELSKYEYFKLIAKENM
ncbi:tetratricopeptide repeat protein [Persephonella sp.]